MCLAGVEKNLIIGAMRTICLLAVYLIVVFGGGALLAPWLYRLTQWGARHWTALAGLAANPFPRFVLRAILGLAVVWLWPLLRACGMCSGREMGLTWSRRPLRNLASGLCHRIRVAGRRGGTGGSLRRTNGQAFAQPRRS